jgi:hypothetical protein
VALSLIMLAYLVVHGSVRAILWGPQAQIDWTTYAHTTSNWFALYRYGGAAAFSEALYYASIAVCLANAVGVMPRLLGLLFSITTSATLFRDDFAMDGGHTLLVILSIYLIFADTSALSLLPIERRKPGSPTLGIFHNGAMAAVSLQVCLVYYWSGFYKLSGTTWRHGTALYYALHDPTFSWPGISNLIYTHPTLVALGTFATIVFQAAFPFLMWVRPVKPVLVAIGFAFHLLIAVLMGLVTFSLTMMSADLALLSDSELAALGSVIMLRRIRRKALSETIA